MKNKAGEGRGSSSVGSKISTAKIKSDIQNFHKSGEMSMDSGLASMSLKTAEIVAVDYETLRVRLRVKTGTREEPVYHGVPLMFPGGGRRSFFGSMPCVGDFCVVGWRTANSDGVAFEKTPIILGYFPAPWWLGRDWVPAQSYAPDEIPGAGSDLNTKFQLEGVTDRTRFIARGLEPGHIVASSSQGSDLVLDESVLLANRRGNEIRLREQDQSVVVRSLNQFHAMSGARVYAGQVQRDARHLPPEMFSDGVYWDVPNLQDVDEYTLRGTTAPNVLTPGAPFQRSNGTYKSDFSQDAEENTEFSTRIDPFHFLRFGSFLSPDGERGQVSSLNDMAVAGGKAYYRVSLEPSDFTNPTSGVKNAAMDKDDAALSEYRIEVTHTSDGTLPVTEQTDGFDVDRLPVRDGGGTRNAPLVEVVYGSVIGNDPFSGQAMYGQPVAPQIKPTPTLDTGIGKSILEHAATLFKVTPLNNTEATWFSVNKSGKVFANMPYGLDLNIGGSSYNFGGGGGGVGISTAGTLNLSGEGQAGKDEAFAVNVQSNSGAVRIYGGEKAVLGASAGEDPPSGEDAPNVLIEGRDNIFIKASSKIKMNARVLDLSNIQQVELASQSAIAMQAGEVIEQTANNVRMGSQESMRLSTVGRSPLSDPAYIHTLTCNPTTLYVPFTKSYVVEQPTGGSYDFMTSLGNWMTNVLVGNQTYNCLAGNITHTTMAGSNTSVLGPAGHVTNIGLGAFTANAVAGPATMVGSVSANLISTVGPTTVRSSSAVFIGSPTPVPGPLMTGAVLDPLFGLPYMMLTLCDTGAIRTV